MDKKIRKDGIYGTVFDKPVSVLIENIRNDMTVLRGRLSDINHEYTGWADRLKSVEGLLTCGIISLHSINDEIIKFEIKSDDIEFGKSIKFQPRGVGLDSVDYCYLCGSKHRDNENKQKDYMNNIAAFVETKELGEEIVGWFIKGARLDYRPSEPNWIQVKIGSCDKHLPNLKNLFDRTRVYGVIREHDIKQSILFEEKVDGIDNGQTDKSE